MDETNAKAKKIFIDHIGSLFFMDRENVKDKYDRLGISPKIEQRWLIELTEIKVSQLQETGNWNSIFFFNHHSDYSHIHSILASQPKGNLQEKCTYLEELTRYMNNGNFEKGVRKEIETYVKLETLKLKPRSIKSIDRVNRILEKVGSGHH